jgi:adenylate cyclase
MGTEAQELVRRVELRCWAGITGANLASALALFPAVIFLWPIFFGDGPIGHSLMLACAAGLPYLAFGTLTGRHLIVRPLLRRGTRWFVDGNEPTPEEMQLLATQPRRQANAILWYWIAFPFWALPYAVWVVDVPFRALTTVKFLVGLAYLAFIAWTLSYMFVERSIRPLLRLSLAGQPDGQPRTMGVYRRLLVAWAASAGFPFIVVMVTYFAFTGAEQTRAVPWLYFISVAALFAGVVATIIASRAITDPLEKVRSGMAAVERGEFDVDVQVDEASEIGVLQMGFNRMAHGLRERERMREIFGHHVGPDVATRAIESEFRLGGELVDATAMFVDMIASSKLAQERPPDEVVAVLNAYFETVVRCVGAEAGYVLKFEGDGALCVFGAPTEQSDHAERALRAARALRKELRGLSENIDAAIGISSGQVVHGNVGAANRYEYTVIGDPVNEASRLTDEAKYRHTRVLASETTLQRAASEAANWGHSGTISLRGRARPTVAFEPGLI